MHACSWFTCQESWSAEIALDLCYHWHPKIFLLQSPSFAGQLPSTTNCLLVNSQIFCCARQFHPTGIAMVKSPQGFWMLLYVVRIIRVRDRFLPKTSPAPSKNPTLYWNYPLVMTNIARWFFIFFHSALSLPEGKPPFSHGFPMVFLSFSHFPIGFPMVFPWFLPVLGHQNVPWPPTVPNVRVRMAWSHCATFSCPCSNWSEGRSCRIFLPAEWWGKIAMINEYGMAII